MHLPRIRDDIWRSVVQRFPVLRLAEVIPLWIVLAIPAAWVANVDDQLSPSEARHHAAHIFWVFVDIEPDIGCLAAGVAGDVVDDDLAVTLHRFHLCTTGRF